jgi:hypothetical protein
LFIQISKLYSRICKLYDCNKINSKQKHDLLDQILNIKDKIKPASTIDDITEIKKQLSDTNRTLWDLSELPETQNNKKHFIYREKYTEEFVNSKFERYIIKNKYKTACIIKESLLSKLLKKKLLQDVELFYDSIQLVIGKNLKRKEVYEAKHKVSSFTTQIKAIIKENDRVVNECVNRMDL